MFCVCQYALNDVVIFLIEILAEEKLHDLVNALAVVKRLDQRLNDRHRSVVGTRVAPAFEIMLFRNVPVAKLGRFVEMRSEMNAKRDLVHPLGVQLQIGRRVVNRISAEDDEHLHASGVDVGDQAREAARSAFSPTA